jgi:hypothetical protein
MDFVVRSLTYLTKFLQAIMAFPAVPASICSPQAIPTPTVFGAKFLSLEASIVTNYTRYVPEYYNMNHGAIFVQNATFCNVTLRYTHPGQNDLVTVEAWLPLDSWNGRLQAIGGGGWVAGMFELSYMEMAGAIGEGYATITTDAGLGSATSPTDWALLSSGNVNLYALQNLGSVSLNDEAIVGKSLIESFYGEPPKYSYWSGCSQGGRQGLMLAQRYPTVYDGIVASAPAINWGEFVATLFWPQLIMRLLRQYPHGCELDELTAAAILACDGNDGVVDGLISDMDSCHFDPFSLVGTVFNCSTTGSEMQISETAAIVANATWTGARSSDGSFLWYGLNYGADLTGDSTIAGIATTHCFSNDSCVGVPLNLSTQWFQLFVEKDPAFNYANLTHQDFDRIVHASVQRFTDIIGTNDPDLSEFRNAGGKMLAFHGLVIYLLTFTPRVRG